MHREVRHKGVFWGKGREEEDGSSIVQSQIEFKRSIECGFVSVWERAIGESSFCVMTSDDTRKRKTKGSLGLFIGANEEEIKTESPCSRRACSLRAKEPIAIQGIGVFVESRVNSR